MLKLGTSESDVIDFVVLHRRNAFVRNVSATVDK
jgi:hypothetical protein